MKLRPKLDPAREDAPLTVSEEAFVNEYLRNGQNGTGAWMLTHPGASPSSAAVMANRTLRKVKVHVRLEAERKRLTKTFQIDRDGLLQQFLAIAMADPNELTQMRHLACGHCYGGKRGDALYVDPDQECEICAGEGVAVPWIADTRKLTPAARALFAGIKQTRDGAQVLMHDKVAALVSAGKIIGAFEADNSQKNKPVADAMREFFATMHGNRLPIAKADTATPPAPPGHPLVGAD